MAKSKCRWEAPSQWNEWSEWLAAGLHARNRWRLAVLLLGILFASGRRTVTTWLRAAGVSDDFQNHYYLLAAVGRKTKSIATQLVVLILRTLPLPERLLLVIDDSPNGRAQRGEPTYRRLLGVPHGPLLLGRKSPAVGITADRPHAEHRREVGFCFLSAIAALPAGAGCRWPTANLAPGGSSDGLCL